jgi:hypothetical protein
MCVVHGLSEGSCATAFLVGHPRHRLSNGPMFLIDSARTSHVPPLLAIRHFPISSSQRIQPLASRCGAPIWHRLSKSELIADVKLVVRASSAILLQLEIF